MDPVTAVGLAATIVQFVAYGNTVIARLQEYYDSLGEVPKALRDIKIVLPLLLDALDRIEEHTRTDSITSATENVLTRVIEGCYSQVESLDIILGKVLPKEEDSAFRRGKKAISGIHQDKTIASIVQKLRDYIQVLTLHQTTTLTSQPKVSAQARFVFNVPFDRDDGFVGRLSILEQINTQLRGQRRVALAGVGGVGKSQLAIESCYRFRDEASDRHVLWIHASSAARFNKSYQEVAKILALPGHDDPKLDVICIVNDWLGGPASGQWLIVLDNLDSLEALATLPSSGNSTPARNLAQVIPLPRSDSGLIMLTTRDVRVGELVLGPSSSIAIPPMSKEEATALFNRQVTQTPVLDSEDLHDLVERLGFLPLAITQASAFISQNVISVHEYLDILTSDSADVQDLFEEDLGDTRRDHESASSVFQTWRLSFEQIRARKPRAAEMLSLMSQYDRQAIPKNLLVTKSDRLVEVTTSLATLRAFSLISLGTDGATYELHRLVQLATQVWLRLRAEAQFWQSRAILVLAQEFPIGEFENWLDCEKLVPHSLVVCEYLPADNETSAQLSLLLAKKAWFDRKQGRFWDAEDSALKSLQLRKQVFGDQHLATLEGMAVLAAVYHDQSRMDEAVELQIKILECKKRMHGEEHRHTIRAMHDLALMYKGQEQYQKAEELFDLVLEVEKRDLGEEHPETLMTANNLAVTYWSHKRTDEAEALQLQVWEARKRVLGEEHPHTLTTAQNLASTYWNQARYHEAEEIQLKVREILTTVVGEEHPQTLTIAHNLAMTYWKQNRLKEAEALLVIVIAGRQRVLGAEHANTIKSLEGLEVVQGELQDEGVVADASTFAGPVP